jgi:hypothetical protein
VVVADHGNCSARRILALAIAASLGSILTTSSRAGAEPAAPPKDVFPHGHGFELTMRAGAAFSIGNAESALPLADRMGIAPALAVDLGYRLNERLYLGGILAGAPALVTPTPCREEAAGYRCSGAGLGAFGAIARWHFAPLGRLDPWIGGGIAFGVQAEKATREELVGGSSAFCIVGCGPTRIEHVRSTTRYGPDGILEGGLNYRVSRVVGLGVSATAFGGEYLDSVVTERRNGQEVSSDGRDVESRAHLWVMAAGNVVLNFDPPPPPPPRPPPPPPVTTDPATPPPPTSEPSERQL